ncbi:unnamed protein product [Pleuronectes platessa]|uniref:Uncharacterized protein n=1 Tax=Pleuronectes platessa TaxID=8262 RepID=A0A9N7Y534_PLEPL|nr:unnamed protein product [Pleuronectes platessa]
MGRSAPGFRATFYNISLHASSSTTGGVPLRMTQRSRKRRRRRACRAEIEKEAVAEDERKHSTTEGLSSEQPHSGKQRKKQLISTLISLLPLHYQRLSDALTGAA